MVDSKFVNFNINENNKDECPEEKIKRPMNAFMLWSKHKRREISKQDSSLHNAQISKLLGEEWKVLSSENKQPYVEEAQKLMTKHKREHPDYRYKPRKQKNQKQINQYKEMPSKPYKKPGSSYHDAERFHRDNFHSNDSLRLLSEVSSGYFKSKVVRPYRQPHDFEYRHYHKQLISHPCDSADCLECQYQQDLPRYPAYHRYSYNSFTNGCACCSKHVYEVKRCYNKNNSTKNHHHHGDQKNKQKACFSVDNILIKKQKDLEKKNELHISKICCSYESDN